MKLINDGNMKTKKTELEPTSFEPNIDVTWWHQASMNQLETTEIISIISARCRGFAFQYSITPAQARQFAAQLLAHADEVEQAEQLRQQLEAA